MHLFLTVYVFFLFVQLVMLTTLPPILETPQVGRLCHLVTSVHRFTLPVIDINVNLFTQ